MCAVVFDDSIFCFVANSLLLQLRSYLGPYLYNESVVPQNWRIGVFAKKEKKHNDKTFCYSQACTNMSKGGKCQLVTEIQVWDDSRSACAERET